MVESEGGFKSQEEADAAASFQPEAEENKYNFYEQEKNNPERADHLKAEILKLSGDHRVIISGENENVQRELYDMFNTQKTPVISNSKQDGNGLKIFRTNEPSIFYVTTFASREQGISVDKMYYHADSPEYIEDLWKMNGAL